MKSVLEQVHFIGGPWDGFVLSDFPFHVRDTLQMPARPAVEKDAIYGRNESAAGCEWSQRWSPTYRLLSGPGIVTEAFTARRVRYAFTGYVLSECDPRPEPLQPTAPGLVDRLSNCASRILRRMAAWMLAPVDHPLVNTAR